MPSHTPAVNKNNHYMQVHHDYGYYQLAKVILIPTHDNLQAANSSYCHAIHISQ